MDSLNIVGANFLDCVKCTGSRFGNFVYPLIPTEGNMTLNSDLLICSELGIPTKTTKIEPKQNLLISQYTFVFFYVQS